MFNQGNQNTQMYTQITNQQSALNSEPDYGSPITPPSSVQVDNPELFTGLYWMTRWVLQNVVLEDPYFIPSWNILSNNNFQNGDYARLVARSCQQAQQRNVAVNRMQEDLVLPMLEMDAAMRWSENVQFASQYLPPQMQQRAQEWAQRAQQLIGGGNNFGASRGFQQGGGFGNSGGWGNSQPQQSSFGQQGNAWQQKRAAYSGNQSGSTWGQQQQHVSGTNRSGFFSNDRKAAPTVNQAGIRTLNTALERSTVIGKGDVEEKSDTDWSPRGATNQSGGWTGKSTQQLAAETQKTVGKSPLEELLPQDEWKVSNQQDESPLDVLDTANNKSGSSAMSHDVNITDALTSSTNVGPAVSDIGCPVLRAMAEGVYGERLPMASILTGQHNSILVQPHGQTELPVESLSGENALAEKLAYGGSTILVDYIYADYELEKLVSKIAPITEGDADMDYMKHILHGPVTPANPKHHVQAANLAKPIQRVADEGMVTKHGVTVDVTKATYSSLETSEYVAASIKAQTYTDTDKSIEVYDKVVVPFVVPEDFDRTVFSRMVAHTSENLTAYIDELETLPRPMQLAVSVNILKDVNFTLKAKLDAEMQIEDFDDVVEVYDYLKANRSEKLAAMWLSELSYIMANNIRVVPDSVREDALKALGDGIPKKTDSLVLLERERYTLTLPYTLAELNITAKSDDMFYVQDTAHAELYEAVLAIFERLVKTNISNFQLRLADGVVYNVAKLVPVAKTYTFTKV